jgi:hypothetical protein
MQAVGVTDALRAALFRFVSFFFTYFRIGEIFFVDFLSETVLNSATKRG